MMSSEPADARGCPGEIGSNSISGGKLSLPAKAPTVSDKASPYGATNHAVWTEGSVTGPSRSAQPAPSQPLAMTWPSRRSFMKKPPMAVPPVVLSS